MVFVTIFNVPFTTGDLDTLVHVAPADWDVAEYKT
jgi:hypothetical protein